VIRYFAAKEKDQIVVPFAKLGNEENIAANVTFFIILPHCVRFSSMQIGV
jgi:hypothetical protein